MKVDDDKLAPFRAVGRGRVCEAGAVLESVAGETPLAAPADGRVLMAGDWHGSTGHALGVLHLRMRPSAISTIVHVGDFGFWGAGDHGQGEGYLDAISASLVELGATLLVVDGNHEDFDLLDRFPVASSGPAAGLRPVRPRIWHLPRGCRWQWPGADGPAVTWVAVGGAVSVDRAMRVPGVSWWPQESLTDAEADAVIAAGSADVLVCHDRPRAAATELGELPGSWHARAPAEWDRADLLRSDEHSTRLQRVVDGVQPAQVWHGHLHQRYDLLIDPASWGGACHVHGLAHDGQPGGNTAIAGLDGRLQR